MCKTMILLLTLVLVSNTNAENWLYVVNGTSETLSRINLSTMNVQNHVLTTGPVPNQIAYYDGLLYLVNSGSASFQVIEPETPATIAEIPLPVNSNPLNCDFWNGNALVSGFITNSVYRIDLTSRQIEATYHVGQSPAGVLVYNDHLFVAITAFNPNDFSFGQGKVTKVDLIANQVIGSINVGKNPQFLAIGTDGILNVICTGDYVSHRGKIYFVEPSTLSVIDSLSTGGDPLQAEINRYGIGFISAGGWSGAGHVFCYDAISRTLLRGESNPILVSTGAMGLAIDSLGFIYSAGQVANSVSKFDNNGSVHATFAVGAGPVSITIIDSRTEIVDFAQSQPDEYDLGKPYPNPFNDHVIIPIINFGGDERMMLDIFDVGGRLLRGIEPCDNGTKFYWDGRDINGMSVASGVYIAKINGKSRPLKLMLLR